MQTIPVFLASDEKYAPFMTATILSILETTASFIAFYILDSGITDRSKEKINFSIKDFENYTIEYLKIDINEAFKNFPDKCHFSKSMYNRLLIPELKPELKKVVYSDTDVIFISDIKSFYDVDLDGYGIAATLGENCEESQTSCNISKKIFNISKDHKYFQSGNLVIDCEYWRKNNIIKRVFEAIEKYNQKLICPDVDALNIVFDNNYKMLDYRYSICTNAIENKGKFPDTIKAEKNPFLIHFAGSLKPWNFPCVPLSEHFWYYIKKTAFYEDVLFEYFEYIKEYKISEKNKKSKIKRLKYKILSKYSLGKTRKKYAQKYADLIS